MMINPLLEQARCDYNPQIVAINESAILGLRVPPQSTEVLAQNELKALVGKSFKDCVRFLIAFNSINYQFWDIKDAQFVRYQNKGYTGALGAFEGFLGLYEHMQNHEFDINYVNVTVLENYLGNISDKTQRVDILREAFDTDKFEEVYSRIKASAINVHLAQKIADILPKSYADPYLKKIQLALYEISQIHHQHSSSAVYALTVAADYQVPKVLEGLGILSYSAALSETIANLELIDSGSAEEKSIRAATILACERISEHHKISIPALDKMLWQSRNNFKNKNFHLTKTSCY